MSDQTRTVEVKVRYQGDGLSWETRPVAATFDVRRQGLVYVVDLQGGYKITTTAAVKAIAIDLDAVEARWNFAGSDQGHYNSI